ncbi:MAG: cupin domain-containing protein [Gammaproteobacteria bacterium]|nr:MAG: cupin domain-containing protein [Gammaproteobacteria bacterium]
MPERAHRHQFNENAVRMTRTLGMPAGLTQMGLHLIRLEPGFDSTQFHYHDADEEFVLVLSGQGQAFIGDETFDVGPGDFMGFPAPSPGHGLHNNSETDLVYLVGGESNPSDVVHYPWIRRTMIKSHGRRSWVDWSDLHDL